LQTNLSGIFSTLRSAARTTAEVHEDERDRFYDLTMNQAFRQSLTLLFSRRFGTFWFASLLSGIGTWAQQVAEPWLLLNLGASPFLIGLDSFAMNAPVVLLSLAGGALADRSDRRMVITFFQSLQMLCPILIIILLMLGRIEPWIIIGLSVMVGITDALSMPSFQSIIPSIVAHEQIGTGIALNSTQFNLSRIIGPAVAGLLMTSAGVISCFAISAVSYVPFICVALWILPHWSRPVSSAAKAGTRHPLANIGLILRQQHVPGTLLTILNTSLFCSPLVTFLPVLVKAGFQDSAGRFSIMVACFGCGALLGALGLLGVGPKNDRRRLSNGWAIVQGVALIIIAVNPWFWLMPPLMILAGAAMAITSTSANTLLQLSSASRHIGQTVSLYLLAMRGGMSCGALLMGLSVSFLGIQHALLLNGCGAVIIQCVIAFSRPGTWPMTNSPTPEPKA